MPFVALDGRGAITHGTRYTPPGHPVVSLASEAGLAVLVALRYRPLDRSEPDDLVLGWTDVEAVPERAPDDEELARRFLADWLLSGYSLLASVRSRVLPEADVVLMNPCHRGAAGVAPLTVRGFRFSECLHEPPMATRYLAKNLGDHG
ncbi:RES domain-containing protein [Novosphingobium sp. CF614]|nr:RES domain-containing protein [Novosphingobium sp. CF614]